MNGGHFPGLKMEEERSAGGPFYSTVIPVYSTLTAVPAVLMEALTAHVLGTTGCSCLVESNC